MKILKSLTIASVLLSCSAISYFSCKKDKRNEFIEEKNEISDLGFWASELAVGKELFFDKGEKLWVLDEKGNLFEFSAEYGWEYQNLFQKLRSLIGDRWRIRGVKQGNIIIQKDNMIYFVDWKRNQVVETGISADNPFYFISSSHVVFWDNGVLKSMEITEGGGRKSEELFKLFGKPDKLYAVELTNKVFVFWNSDGETFYFSSGKIGRVGEFLKKESVSFNLVGNRYVAYTSGEVFGNIKEDVKLFMNGKEISNFSFDIQEKQIVIYIDTPPEDMPPNPYFEVRYMVAPEGKQIGFSVDVAEIEKNKFLYFIDTEIQYVYKVPGEDKERKWCKTYLGYFDGTYFRREIPLPSNLCEVYFSYAYQRYAFSFFDDVNKISYLVFLWNNMYSQYILDGIAYPFVIPDFPYFLIINNNLSDEGKTKVFVYNLS